MSQTFSNARKCSKCGHEWIRRKNDVEPKQCPRCRSEKWQQVKIEEVTK